MDIEDKVYLKSNPNKTGILQRKIVKNDRTIWYVKFDKQITQYPESYLALCDDEDAVYPLPALISVIVYVP